jgi:hypothetical protein
MIIKKLQKKHYKNNGGTKYFINYSDIQKRRNFFNSRANT